MQKNVKNVNCVPPPPIPCVGQSSAPHVPRYIPHSHCSTIAPWYKIYQPNVLHMASPLSPRGGGVEKTSWYRRTAFFGGVTPGGGGGYGNKIRTKNYTVPQNMKFPQLHLTYLGWEGARRIFFKVTIDVSADMGGICVSEHKDPWFVPAAVPTLAPKRQAQEWVEMLHNPCILGGPQQTGQNQRTKKARKTKTFPLCHTSCLWTCRFPAPEIEPETFPSQTHRLPARVRAISHRCPRRDGIGIWSNMALIHY